MSCPLHPQPVNFLATSVFKKVSLLEIISFMPVTCNSEEHEISQHVIIMFTVAYLPLLLINNVPNNLKKKKAFLEVLSETVF